MQKKVLFSLGLFCVFATIITVAHTKCIHDEVVSQVTKGVSPQVYDDAKSDWQSRNAKRSFATGFSPLRITFDVSFLTVGSDTGFTCYSSPSTITIFSGLSGSSYNCLPEDVLSPTKFNFINGTLLVQAKDALANTFGVRPVTGNLFLRNDPSFNCYLPKPEVFVPDSYKQGNAGLADTDIVIFVTARHINSASVLAFAAECDVDQNGRPIAGFINFDPAKMDENNSTLLDQYLKTAMHELTHVLGFSFSKFSNYKLPDGVTPRPPNTILVNVTNGANTLVKIKSPSVLSMAQSYFNCPTLDGVELEDDGGAGTALSHWEKRVLFQDYMIGTASKHPFFSPFTAALFNDSGFYSSDFNSPFLEELQWGRGAGCAFVQPDQCNTAWTQVGTKCATDQTSCAQDRRGIGKCFETDDLMDGCSYIFTFDNLWCIEPGTTRAGGILNINYDSGESFSPASRCFTSSLIRNVPTGAIPVDLCYPTACAGPNRLKVVFDGFHYPCVPGTSISILNFGGSLTCPPDTNLCGGVADDPTWAEITSVNPAATSPNAEISIAGSAFVTGATFKLDNVDIACTFVSATEYKCTLPAADKFDAFQAIIDKKHSIFYSPPSGGKTAVGVSMVDVNLSGADIANNILKWFTDNPLYTGLIFGGIALLIGVGIFLVIQQRRRAKAAQKSQNSRELPMN